MENDEENESYLDITKINVGQFYDNILKIARTIQLNTLKKNLQEKKVDENICDRKLKRKKSEGDIDDQSENDRDKPLRKIMIIDNTPQVFNETKAVETDWVSCHIKDEIDNKVNNDCANYKELLPITETNMFFDISKITEQVVKEEILDAGETKIINEDCNLNQFSAKVTIKNEDVAASDAQTQSSNVDVISDKIFSNIQNVAWNEFQISKNTTTSPQLQRSVDYKKKNFQTNQKKNLSRPFTSRISKHTNHTNVVEKHYNLIKEHTLSQRNHSYIINLRNFNNWIKSILIKKYIEKIKRKKIRKIQKKSLRSINIGMYNCQYEQNISVLDMCCGKGGDLYKWKNYGISYLISTDIAEKSVRECRNRYQKMCSINYKPPFQAEFIVHDCTQAGLRKKFIQRSKKFDLVSCQFALHYSFETKSQAKKMLKNASRNLKSGGFFIGTMPNESELLSRWYATKGNKFGNEIYHVEFECDKRNPPFYGAKYHFYLKDAVDCPEFLVNSAVLQELALKYNLEFIVFKSFSDFYEKMKVDSAHLMHRMHELLPPHYKDENLYNSPRNRHKSNRYHRKKTLTQAEWEVITLYSVFVFKKK